jgi:uncharacterized protein with FMN-binding domain
MKRALLIAGGTIGGLGAVLTITPPQFSQTQDVAAPEPSATQSAAPEPTQGATTQPTTPAPTTPAKPVGGVSGSFTGAVSVTRYGNVQVKITVENGKITDAQAVQVPSGRNDRYTQMSVPVLRERTIAAQSANIQAVSGASFTSYGWYTSLASAIAKAGL